MGGIGDALHSFVLGLGQADRVDARPLSIRTREVAPFGYGSSLVRSLSSRIASINLGSVVFAIVSSFVHAQIFAGRRPGIDAVQFAVQVAIGDHHEHPAH